MANIQLSVPTTSITVDSTNSLVNVSSTSSNVQVGAAISARFTESVVDNGSVSGNVTFVATSGTIHQAELVGNITGITFSSVETGQSFTLILTQDLIGGNYLDTTTFTSNWTNWEFVNSFTEFDATGGNFNIMNVVYDGSKYYASLVTEASPQASTADIADGAVTNAKLANSNVIVNGTTIDLGSSGNISHFGALTTDNLPEGSTNLYLNGAGTTDDLTEGSANLYFTNARARAALSAVSPLSYNSETGVFTITEVGDISEVQAGNGLIGGGTTGIVTLNVGAGNGITVNSDNIAVDMSVFTTSDLTEGTNLYYTTARANSAIVTYLGDANNGPFSINGNLDVAGNLNYENVVDLYVANTEIIMNANAASDVNVTITANRPVAGSNAHLRWNESADYWEIFDGSNTFVIPRSTTDLAEGTNLYYTNARVDAHISGGYGITYTGGVIETTNADVRALISATGNINYDAANGIISESLTTTDITEGDNLYYTDARANSAIATKLLDSSRKDAFNLRVQDLSVSSDAANGTVSYFFPNSQPGSAGQMLLSSDATNLGFSDFTDEANTAIGAYQGNINTTGNITAAYFSGDGSLLTNVTSDVETETVQRAAYFTEDIDKGEVVCITGGTGDNPNVALALASNSSLMPAIGIALETATATNTGNIAIYGEVGGIDTSAFSNGDEVFVSSSTAGGLQNTPPTTEANLIQKVGKVVKSASGSGGKIMVTGAGRTNATPNLDDGAIFAGNSTNQAVAVDTTTNFDVSDTEFDLANALSNINSIGSESGSNIVLDTNTGTSVTIRKDQGATTDVDGLFIESDGYSGRSRLGLPSYSGTANLTSFVGIGSATAGSPNIVLTSGCEFLEFKTSNAFGNAATLSTLLSSVSANMVLRSGSITSTTQSPFPAGTKVLSVDAGANTITMSQNAVSNHTFEHIGSSWASSVNKLALFQHGFFDDDTGLIEGFQPEYDFTGGSRSSISATSSGTFATYFNPITLNRYGYGSAGPTLSDVTSTFNDLANVSSLGNYAEDARVTLQNDKTWLALEDGLLIGNASPTARMVGDYDVIPGLNMMWDGTKTWSNTTWYNNPTFQIGMRQFTDNSVQNANPHLGPRMLMISSKGNAGDSEYDWYPRAGQELGRFAFWGTLGNDPQPPQTIPPAYISAQASDDWTVGSNTSMYFMATSNYANSTTSRENFIAYEKGNLILASGQLSTDVSKNAGITFAPVQSGGANPANLYGFNGTVSTLAQDPKWTEVNFANVSANSGAKISITHGSSAGAGTVGDQVLELKRNNNTIIANVVVDDMRWLMNASYANTVLELETYGFAVSDCIRVNSGNASLVNSLLGEPVTFANITDPNWTHYNSNTFVLRSISFSPFFAVYDSTNTSPIVSTQTSNLASFGSPSIAEMTFDTSTQSGVTEFTYSFELPEQESNLHIKANDVTTIQITGDDEVNFTAIPVVPSKTVAELANTTATAGGVAFCSDETGGAVLAFADGTSWRRSTDRANVS